MFLTNILCKKVKSKHVLVLLERTVSKHKVPVKRERIADKMEQVRFDPPVCSNIRRIQRNQEN